MLWVRLPYDTYNSIIVITTYELIIGRIIERRGV